MAPFFEVDNLTKSFGGLVAVNEVSFKIERDEIVGLIGPNGSGKTTLIRCILGILKPDSGKVRFKGEDITKRRPWDVVQKGIVGTFQVVKPFRRLPIIANVMVGCLCPRATKRGEWVKRAEVKARDALEFVGIMDLALEPAYPEYLEVAGEEGNKQASWSFNVANQVERIHAGLYNAAAEAVKNDKDLKQVDYYVCQVCGNTVENEPPEKCPICNAPTKSFLMID